ncbi:hypothetical protein QCA50_001335 [Cerrena zonata]|uniref:Uncharacterized protein n=1 Tax=Cerrena zonata TaxID=2478898 RepID=A0AAW0GLQ3_9APHY
MRALTRSSLCILLPTLVPSICAISNVTWLRPVEGDIYEPGQSITGQWSTTEALYSPSFRLCSSSGTQKRNNKGDKAKDKGKSQDEEDSGDDGDDDGDGDCGSEVWPTVQHHNNGSYQIVLSVPNVTSQADFYLELQDDEGVTAASPPFSLRPALLQSTNSSSTPPTNPVGALSSADPPSESGKSSPHTPPTVSAPNPNPSASPSPHNRDTTSPSSIPNPSPTPNPDSNSNTNNSTSHALTNLLQTHMPVPAAAYAVPLSLVGFVTLSALILCIHHRRRLQTERNAESEKVVAGEISRASSIARYPTRVWRAAFGNLGRGAVGGVGTGLGGGYGAGGRGGRWVGGERVGIDGRVETPTMSRRSSIARISREKEDTDIYTPMYVPSLYNQQQTRHHNQPRQHTRDAYPTPSRRRERTIPARQFREATSPTYNKFSRYAAEEADDDRTTRRVVSPPPPRVPPKDRWEGDVEEDVLSHYMHPSPLSSIPEPTPPRRAHARRSARTDSRGGYDEDVLYPDVYAEVARRLPGPR